MTTGVVFAIELTGAQTNSTDTAVFEEVKCQRAFAHDEGHTLSLVGKTKRGQARGNSKLTDADTTSVGINTTVESFRKIDLIAQIGLQIGAMQWSA